MRIRVLHIIGSLRLGGAQVVVKQIVENASEGVEHFVYPLRSKKIDIPIEGNVLSNPYPNYGPRKFFDILKVCKTHKIDIIHAHLHKPIIGALLTTYFQNIPIIVHEHGSIARPGIQYALYRFALRRLRKRADAFIAVSKAISGQLTRYANINPGRIKVINNAVDLEKFVPNPALRQSIRDELAIGPDDIVIGFVGRLSYVKGPDILLDAFKILVRKKPKCLLVFLGRGDMEKRLRSEAQIAGLADRVKFLGFRKNVAEIMNAFDIAAITSRQDAFPLTPLEIMSMKTPLMSCNVYGLAEIVTHGQNALVPKNNAPPEISVCIEEIISDNTLKKTLTKNAFRDVQNFSIPKLVHQIECVYQQIVR